MPLRRSTILSAGIALAVLVTTIPAAAARKPHRHGGLPQHASYKGATSQGKAINFRLSNDAKRVAKLRISYNVTCDNRTSVTTYTEVFNAPISARGFAGHGVYKGKSDGSTNTYRIKGSLTGTSAHGTFSLSATAKTSTGADLHCMSGKLTWNARKFDRRAPGG